jgi:hypothetical protein
VRPHRLLHLHARCLTPAAAAQNHGGRIEVKVPRAGYILVEPHSLEEGRLRACWQAPDRPERYFVPHRWVEACESAGQLLKQIFVKDGQPLRVYVHPSIANVNVRNTLYTRIVVRPAVETIVGR